MKQPTIDDVIARLDAIIEACHTRGSRLGYFPAMYRKTTLLVRDGLATGRFEDPVRMEKLDVVFAERYLQAFDQFGAGEEPTGVWAYAFQMGGQPGPSVLQHLLLGMNAHINLDLGIAAAEVASGSRLPALETDFKEINVILGELVDDVQDDLSSVFPRLGLLDWLGGRLDEVVSHLSITQARAAAWRQAQVLADLTSPGDRPDLIRTYDREAVAIAHAICPPRRARTTHSESYPETPDHIRQVIEALTE